MKESSLAGDTILLCYEYMHILLADKALDTRQLYSTLFYFDGHSTVLVDNGAQVIQAVQDNRFDVILMNTLMRGSDGVSAIKCIRLLANGHKVPIILITAHGCADDGYGEQPAHEVGANLLMHRPILLRDLLGHIKRLHSEATSTPC